MCVYIFVLINSITGTRLLQLRVFYRLYLKMSKSLLWQFYLLQDFIKSVSVFSGEQQTQAVSSYRRKSSNRPITCSPLNTLEVKTKWIRFLDAILGFVRCLLILCLCHSCFSLQFWFDFYFHFYLYFICLFF